MNEISYYRAIDLLGLPGGTTIYDLQNELGVSRRTVYRLLERLQEQGFPIYDEEGVDRKKRWRFEEGFLKRLPNTSFPDLQLNRDELILLSLVLGKEMTLGDSKYEKVLKSLRYKLSQWIDSGSKENNDISKSSRFISALKSGRKCYLGSEKILDDLISAIEMRRICKTRYFAFSKQRELVFSIHPVHIFEWNRGLYVFCLLEPDMLPRMLAVERFTHLEATDLKFDKPKIDPESLLEDAFAVTWDDPITVRVRFTKRSAQYAMARRWSSNQKFENQADGSVDLVMTTSGIGDVVHWILGFGPGVKVIEPDSLREEVKRNLECSLSQYS